MKKYIILFAACNMLLCFATGCAEVQETGLMVWSGTEEEADFELQENQSLLYTEEGYFVAEGRLCEMEKGGFSVETEDGQKLGFKISPETIIYTGENSEMLEGQAVKVVFDGKVTGDSKENVTVIAITALEE